MREANWKFVETGSKASTTHADLGGMAASVLDAKGAGRVPMPLVAPAVKAVAQTALRSSTTEQRPSGGGGGGLGGPDGESEAGKAAQPELSKEAFEKLCIEMADRFELRAKRNAERRGTKWR